MLGTKCPSITSTWIQSAPASSIARISSANLAKSADRIDGAIKSGRGIHGLQTRSGNTERAGGQRVAGMTQTATNADGSTTTTISYVDGTTVSMTTPAASEFRLFE